MQLRREHKLRVDFQARYWACADPPPLWAAALVRCWLEAECVLMGYGSGALTFPTPCSNLWATWSLIIHTRLLSGSETLQDHSTNIWYIVQEVKMVEGDSRKWGRQKERLEITEIYYRVYNVFVTPLTSRLGRAAQFLAKMSYGILVS